MFYLISKIGWNKRYPILCEEFENEKKKEQKIFVLPEQGFEHQFSVIFPPIIWIVMGSEIFFQYLNLNFRFLDLEKKN